MSKQMTPITLETVPAKGGLMPAPVQPTADKYNQKLRQQLESEWVALEAMRRAEQPTQQETVTLEEYDAGILNDFGGGNVEWWQDYIRAELGRAYEHYQSQTATPQPAQRKPLSVEKMFEAIRPLYSSNKAAWLAVNHSKDEYRAIEAAHDIKETT